MNDEDFKEGESRSKDQIDGTKMSLGNRKGVRVSGRHSSPVDWSSRRGGPSIIHSPTSSTPLPPETPTLISISPLSHKPPVASYGETSVARQTMEELKTILRDSPMLSIRGRDEGKPGSPYTYLHGSSGNGNGRSDGRQVDGNPNRTFSTFKPQSDASRSGARFSHGKSIQQPSCVDSSSPIRADANTNRLAGVRAHTHASSGSWAETGAPHSDNDSVDIIGNQRFIANMEQIKQQIARENINFVRFEATDLHGVSRSKTVPVRFFHEKAVYGIPMPRSYLELTLSPKSNEVDNASTANFSGDVLLIPDLSTFRVLPWAEQTARVICDPCTVAGNPLRTSPRLIAKQLLAQLQSLGFSLHSSFSYECCVLGAPDRIGPKTLLFPATTLLSNHDLPFFQQLVDSMYCMGADIDSIASASGPGQMEINLRPEFGIAAADTAFTFRTGIKEMARKYSYIASFFTDDGLYNAGVLSHSLWDANGRRSLFKAGRRPVSFLRLAGNGLPGFSATLLL
ncbi:Lengsin [Dissostichus eleginoides]|uniref:Lengsin n=1 Tax=Dissostichus eleginoides TaxID=100907 RepID=A0AAD9BMR0_DISEL|nr:Lengsin [Dissostichus eleginoides]